MDPLASRLREERERQGLTVRDLSVVTKIREPYIEAVERGRYDVLPAVYVRSFVKTLGTSLGLSQHEMNLLMQQVFDGSEDALRLPRSSPPTQPPPGLESTVQKASEVVSTTVSKASEAVGDSIRKIRAMQPPAFFTDRPRFIMLLALLAALALVVIFVLVIAGGREPEKDVTNADADSAITVAETPVAGSGMPLDSMRLTATVTDSAWITITMDGARTREQVLAPKGDYEWRANEKFVLNITNAGGVRFYRDGVPLPLFGRRGEAVRSIRITRTDVVSSSQPVDGRSQQAINSASPPRPQPRPAQPPAQPQPRPKPQAQPQQRSQPSQAPAQRQTRDARRRPANSRNIPLITPAPTRPPR
jgi:cytoskeletal protein RodZ